MALSRAAAAGVALLACVLYWPIREHQWLSWDDFTYITQNPHVVGGLTLNSVEWAFTSFHLANWFPLTWLSWMLDVEIHGLDAGGFLTTNLLLHAANSALLCAALARMTGARGRSAFVAAVFAVHPLHVESVAWAAARKDLVCGLFWMLAMWFHGGSGPPGRRRRAVAVCYLAAFAAKPTAITLPFALLLLDDWPLARTRTDDDPDRATRRGLRAALVDKVWLWALLPVFAVVTFLAQRSGGVVQQLEALPLGMRVSNALTSYVAYLFDCFWPRGLAFFYPHPGDSTPGWQVAAAGALLAGVTITALARHRTRPALSVGWLWFLGTLLPVIGLVQVGAQARADRYMYLPLVGIALVVGWAAPPRWLDARTGRAIAATAGAIAVLALSWVTAQQIPYWRDSTALYERGLAVTTRNHVAHAHLGGVLMSAGQTAEAVEHYEAALAISPDFMRVANNLAWILATSARPSLRDPARAVELAELAVSLAPEPSAELLDTLAAAEASSRRFDRATDTATRAVEVARAAGDEALASDIADRLALYRRRRPYREGSSEAGAP